MFDLEKEIANRNEALTGDGTIDREAKWELESHLRESVIALREQGLSEQEAFLVATIGWAPRTRCSRSL